MPDEDARAYWGRILRLNAVPAIQLSETQFTTSIRNRISTNGCDRPDLAFVISSVTGIPLPTVISAHTLVPFSGAILPIVNGNWCDQSYTSRELRRTATHRRTSNVSLCPECVAEDLDFWGFSYWRRSHQPAGIVSCSKHCSALFRAREIFSWQTLPHEALPHATPESDEVVACMANHPALRRYTDACTEFLDKPRPLSTLQVFSAMTQRAKKIGLMQDTERANTCLSDFAADALADAAPTCLKCLGTEAADATFHALDATLSRLLGVCKTQTYALAFALLYDSIDEAFNDVSRPLPTLQDLLPAIEVEASRRPRNELPRSPAADLACREVLREAAEMVLNGYPVHEAARIHNTSSPKLEKTLMNCLAAANQHALA